MAFSSSSTIAGERFEAYSMTSPTVNVARKSSSENDLHSGKNIGASGSSTPSSSSDVNLSCSPEITAEAEWPAP